MILLQHMTTGRLLAFIKKVAGKAATGAVSQATAKSEPRLVWDDVPVYSVTLAEDISPTTSERYTIELEDDYPAIWVSCVMASVSSGNSYAAAYVGDGTIRIDTVLRTSNSFCALVLSRMGNALVDSTYGGNATAASKAIYHAATVPVISDDGYSKLELYGQTIAAGTTITVYGAQEAA